LHFRQRFCGLATLITLLAGLFFPFPSSPNP
jgi:hypothetical protein